MLSFQSIFIQVIDTVAFATRQRPHKFHTTLECYLRKYATQAVHPQIVLCNIWMVQKVTNIGLIRTF